ncbi:hypothetical protein FYB92_04285 [Novacetimonas sp. GS1]
MPNEVGSGSENTPVPAVSPSRTHAITLEKLQIEWLSDPDKNPPVRPHFQVNCSVFYWKLQDHRFLMHPSEARMEFQFRFQTLPATTEKEWLRWLLAEVPAMFERSA